MSIRYITGHPELGQSPEKGFDCSGFARFVLIQSGLYIPDYIGMDGMQRPIRHTNELWDHYGLMIEGQAEGGDLIFFSRNGIVPTHVGIVLDKESYIHAPGNDHSEVKIDSIEFEPIIPKTKDERILYSVNPIGFKAPTQPIEHPSYRYHQRLVK